MLDQYKIEGTEQRDTHPCFDNPASDPDFQENWEDFKSNLIADVRAAEDHEYTTTYYKFGDGDYYFLKEISHGSAAPGKRALSRPYSELPMDEIRKDARLNDYYLVELYPENRMKFFEAIPETPIDFAAEFTYAAVTSRWIFQQFRGKIGLIGGSEKMKLIQELMKHEEYQNYLGIDRFEDYVSIPEKFACDNIYQTRKMVLEQLEKCSSKIFLVGIGHTKNGLLGWLRKNAPRDVVFLDVGTGINAIAGTVSLERPYCGGWTNFRLKDYDYSNVDSMDYRDTAGQQEVWL